MNTNINNQYLCDSWEEENVVDCKTECKDLTVADLELLEQLLEEKTECTCYCPLEAHYDENGNVLYHTDPDGNIILDNRKEENEDPTVLSKRKHPKFFQSTPAPWANKIQKVALGIEDPSRRTCFSFP